MSKRTDTGTNHFDSNRYGMVWYGVSVSVSVCVFVSSIVSNV